MVSHNTASSRGSVFDVDSAHVVQFLNVTFEHNSGISDRLHVIPSIGSSDGRSIPDGTNDTSHSSGTGIGTISEDCICTVSNQVQVAGVI